MRALVGGRVGDTPARSSRGFPDRQTVSVAPVSIYYIPLVRQLITPTVSLHEKWRRCRAR